VKPRSSLADPKLNSAQEPVPDSSLPPLRPEPIDGGAAETEGWWPRPVLEVDEPFNSPRRWAGRLAFPLLALAVVLAWWGIKVNAGEPSRLPDWAWWTLAALSVMVGLSLMRIRHRR
jgi:hypothetical protein